MAGPFQPDSLQGWRFVCALDAQWLVFCFSPNNQVDLNPRHPTLPTVQFRSLDCTRYSCCGKFMEPRGSVAADCWPVDKEQNVNALTWWSLAEETVAFEPPFSIGWLGFALTSDRNVVSREGTLPVVSCVHFAVRWPNPDHVLIRCSGLAASARPGCTMPACSVCPTTTLSATSSSMGARSGTEMLSCHDSRLVVLAA